MNKSAIVARVAARMGLNKSAAEGAVDTVFEAIAEGLAKEEEVRIAGFGTFGTRSRAARIGQESAHRREPADTGLQITVVQGGETAAGGGEAGLARGAGGTGRGPP